MNYKEKVFTGHGVLLAEKTGVRHNAARLGSGRKSMGVVVGKRRIARIESDVNDIADTTKGVAFVIATAGGKQATFEIVHGY